ncbi:MAG: hypothetical protein KAT09_09895, partial [Candidatus Aegiribacteria sp.]|nr:hypothetical protein [Candidatus Aegiribacteria sp.]
MRPRAIRAIRDALLQLTYYMRERSSKRGYLLLIEPGITDDNLKEEWLKATGVLQTDIANHLFIVTLRNDHLAGIPSDPDIETQEELKRISLLEAPPGKPQLAKPDYSAEILKLLIYHWILNSDH